MPDIKLTITNKYSNKNDSQTITVKGNCQISNFKPNETKPKGFLFADLKDGNASIQQSNGNTQSLDFSDEKFKVMQKIASASNEDGKTELSWFDLRDMDNKKLGLDDSFVIKKDLAVGIANIYKKVNGKLTTFLHIDFETKGEKSSTTTEPPKKQEAAPQKTATFTYSFSNTRVRDGSTYRNNKTITIPTNTIIEGDNGKKIYINDKGETYYSKYYKKLEKVNSLPLDGVTLKLLTSIAENNGRKDSKLDLTKEDLNSKINLLSHIDDFQGNQAYEVTRCDISDNSISAEIDSHVFSCANHKISINFDTQFSPIESCYGKAKQVYEQISGPSLNENTFKLFKELYEEELLGTLKAYNQNKMFTDLNDEWNVGKKEIMPIMDKAFKAIPIYLQDRCKNEYNELKKIIDGIDRKSDENFDDKTITKIDELFAKILNYKF